MPTKKPKGSKPRSPYTLDQLLQKIVEAPRFIQHHGGLTPTEESRIQDGFDVLQLSNRPSPTMVGNYWQFLKSVEKDSGSEMVGLCAAALGRTAIGRMKDRLRVELALKVKENQANLHCEAVNKAVQAIKQKRKHAQTRDLGTLTGDVYELTKDDARMIANSDQIGGKIWLTDPYDVNTTSFITIPISDELKTQFIIQRPKVM